METEDPGDEDESDIKGESAKGGVARMVEDGADFSIRMVKERTEPGMCELMQLDEREATEDESTPKPQPEEAATEVIAAATENLGLTSEGRKSLELGRGLESLQTAVREWGIQTAEGESATIRRSQGEATQTGRKQSRAKV